MNRGFLSTVLSAWLFAVILPGCTTVADDPVMCTEEYRILTVAVTDSAGHPLVLDSSTVRKSSTGEILRFAAEDPYMDSLFRTQGRCILLTDGKMSMTSGSGTEFYLQGYLNGTQCLNQRYIVGNDRCHVVWISGPDSLVLNTARF